MADGYKTTNYNESRTKVLGYQGAKAGQSFDSSSQVEENKDWDSFKKEKNLMFTAQKKQYEKPFSEWRKTRAAKSGQKEALKKVE